MGPKYIKDELKRAFALGFMCLFERQADENKKSFAAKAGVDSTALTYITRGPENKFPGYPVQVKIAQAFGLQHHEVIFIGREIDAGRGVEIDSVESHAENVEVTEEISMTDLLNRIEALNREIGRLQAKLERYEASPTMGEAIGSPKK